MTLDREALAESVVELPQFDGSNYPASAEAAGRDVFPLEETSDAARLKGVR